MESFSWIPIASALIVVNSIYSNYLIISPHNQNSVSINPTKCYSPSNHCLPLMLIFKKREIKRNYRVGTRILPLLGLKHAAREMKPLTLFKS